jgi:hypothetical protein
MPPAAPHLVCTAVRPANAAPFDSRWRTETAVLLARGIIKDVAFDRTPILADALEDAGCDDLLLLRHCRECGEHTTRCWVLGAVLDRPPVVEPPRMTDAEVRREVERVTGRPVMLPTDADRTPGWRTRAWRLLPLLVGAVVLGAVWTSTKTPPKTPYTNTFPTDLTRNVARPR